MRRGNKSHKVPNVKLRPAQASSSYSNSAVSRLRMQHDSWVQDSDELNQPETQSGVDMCPRPFHGAVVCATGILDKPALFTQAMKLGATALLALTDKVTHLIASDHGGAKYTCALERKIPIMQPSWITSCYEIWLRGDDVNFEESIEAHRLPVFSNVFISLSGIDDVQRRTHINKLTTLLGGTYLKNLERPVKVTHLLCAGDTETDKMRYAEKFNKRGEARIQLVWEEWFWDSVEFGGRFDEEKYRVDLPRPERRAIPDIPAPQIAVPKPPLPPALQQILPHAQTPSENDEMEEEELASIKRIPAVTLQLWESLLKPRGFEITGGSLVRSPSKANSQVHGDPEMSPPRPKSKLWGRDREDEADTNGSVIASFKRVNSFAAPIATAVPRQPFRRVASISMREPAPPPNGLPAHRSLPDMNNDENPAGPSSQGAQSSKFLFAGLKFRGLGEARSAVVRTEIESCGGRMVSEEEPDENVDFVLVRLVSGSKLYHDEPDELERAKYRTECWLERCMFEERICLPDEHIAFTPLTIQKPIAGAEKINISFSGLDQSEACWTRRLLRALGVSLAPNFSRRSTHLLCPSGTGAKYDKAREWNVPVVGVDWLVDMAKTGMVASPQDGQSLFGEVHHLLDGDPPRKRRLSTATPPPPTSPGRFSSPPPGSSREPTELEIDMMETRIPSSTSPSPMKMPPSRGREDVSRESLGPSPAKVSNEVTKALQESITSLLGKRQTSEEDPGTALVTSKPGKRIRPPPKSKPQSRHESGESVVPASTIVRAPISRSLSPFGTNDELNLFDGAIGMSYEESMRVRYEDPGERDERKRLLSLFGSQPQGGEESRSGAGRKFGRKGSLAARRSTRMAGF